MSRETKHDTDLRGNKLQNEINISFMRECVCVCVLKIIRQLVPKKSKTIHREQYKFWCMFVDR